MLDSMFQEGTDKVLDDRTARPLPEPVARPSFGVNVWNTVSAPFTGVGAGANESAGFMADMLGAFGSVQAGYGLQADPTLLFDAAVREKRTTEGRKARQEIQSGEAFSTELGTGFRATARSWAPDPATANAAEQILFGLGKFGAKAVGYSLLAGPVPGAVLTGADEGMAEADRLKADGVDIATRTKVGTVAGASAAAATALPVAGMTIKGTAALVAVGGPGSFIAQQAASRAILEHAGYGQLAAQYDPFDPVGLAVSTLVPAGFGAVALRGARNAAKAAPQADPAAARALSAMAGNERLALKFNDPRLDAYAVTAAQREGIPPEALLAIKNVGEKSGSTAVSPKGAKGVMQFLDDTWTAYGKGDVRDPIAAIDAGARYLKALIKDYDGDVRAAIAHYNGGGKAGKAVREGKAPPAAETRQYLERTDTFIAERQGTEAGKAASHDPDAVAAARVALARESIESASIHRADDVRGAEDHMTAIGRASDQIATGSRIDVADVIAPERLDVARVSDVVSRVQRAMEELRVAAAEAAGVRPQAEMRMPAETRTEPGTRPAEQRTGDAPAPNQAGSADRVPQLAPADQPSAGSQIRDQVDESGKLQVDESGKKQNRGTTDAPQDTTAKPDAKPAEAAGQPTPAAADQAGKNPPQIIPKNIPPAGKPDAAPGAAAQSAPAGGPKLSTLDLQAAEIARLSPDMLVQLEGMEQPMRLADALDAVKAEAAKEAQDAPLLQVAAECFLRTA